MMDKHRFRDPRTEECDWAEKHSFERDQQAKKESNDLIQKQFALRRNPQVKRHGMQFVLF